MGEDTFWHLQNIDVTGIFCSKKMAADTTKHVERVFKKGDFIYQPEDQSDKIYFIVHGRVKIGSYGELDKEIIKAVVNKGEVFGELALIDEGVRRDFAIAMYRSKARFHGIIQKQNGASTLFPQTLWLTNSGNGDQT